MESLEKTENIEFLWSSEVVEILADEFVTGVKVKSRKDESIQEIACDGIFVAIGLSPDNTRFADAGLVALDRDGYIDAGEDCITSTVGVFAAGDTRRKKLRQIVTAAADGAVAAEQAAKFLSEQ